MASVHGGDVKKLFIGTAGWSIPVAFAGEFPGDGPHLQRFARVMNAAEINSSFHRSHRRSTYERWSSAVPAGFAFSVKIPKAISHQKRCVGCAVELQQFLNESAGLGATRRVLLLQLPPSFEFDQERMEQFFALCRRAEAPSVVCEPRHASWFSPQVSALLEEWRVARVGADPARVAGARTPGGWTGITYFRMHGAPRVYYSSYSPESLERLASTLSTAPNEAWCIFDNTASGAAAGDALLLRSLAQNNA
jgi:uncharacterized protein YecE (DUF72 family)